MRRLAWPLCALLLCGTAGTASADPPDRLQLLERDATHARIWFWGYMSAYLSAAVVQSTLAFALRDPGDRADQAVGAASSWLGVGGLLLCPIPEVWRAASDARSTGDLDAAMRRAAAAETEGRAWYNHVLISAVALASGAVLWFGFDRPGSAALNASANLLIGEINFWTQPARAMNAQQRTQARVRWVPALQGFGITAVW